MFNTVSVKEQWRQVFRCGNLAAKEVILLLGSCRVVPYLNYLYEGGAANHLIYCIDPINYQVDEAGGSLDTVMLLLALEKDEHFLHILRSTTIFIHEGLGSFGILNTIPDSADDIYRHGMQPSLDISVPNFHDVFLLANDFAQFRPPPVNAAGEELLFLEGEANIDRFCKICAKSSFPEFAAFFLENYLEKRLFHSFNHVSSAFTLEMFRLMNNKFLHWDLDDAFWQRIGAHDMYANRSTPVCDLDRKWRAWGFT